MKTYFLIILSLQSIFLFTQSSIGTNGFQFEISDTGINTKFSEIGSGFFKEKLIMVSSKKIGALAKIDPNTNEAYKELYCLDTLGNGILANPLLFSRILNTNDSEGQISFSPNQKTVYYSRSSKTNSLEFKLYKAILEEGSHGNWVNEKLLSINRENVSIENPFVNAKCDKLYFSANMPNAIGGYDIYVSDINPDGTLSTPKNLGEKINTHSDDKYPYVFMDTYLFFSSKGHEGMGGFDFFVSEISKDGYKTPINMGNTINSKYDEVAYFNVNNSAGYFSSNRPNGKGGFDIYYFTTNHIKQTVEGKILDFNTKEVLPNTTVILKDRNQKEIDQLITGKDGTYRFNVAPLESYTITTKKNNFKDGSFDFASYRSENTTYNKNLEIAATVPVIAEVNNELRIISENIYFDFAKHDIKKESYIILNKIIKVLNDHPKIKIAINSHTDNKGSDAFNLNLSEKRAKSTLNYLIKNGISKNRLSSKGCGERKPLIDCKNSCSKKDLQTNRRVEFVILNTTP
ncbi:OmpA family protein [Flavivirga abyssicola]|uniref:OmpA family protein n=1 Tax=Flavivirga abyssicola TaxID=3063533 RepID=UPI0026E10A4B|nr:OmpA family protein [Flavivirga sp. MEBiC07777]WVK14331.1 OmpA family protein [Flavivirga sp. MEBiC07777]